MINIILSLKDGTTISAMKLAEAAVGMNVLKRLLQKDADGCFLWEHLVAWAIVASPLIWMICHF